MALASACSILIVNVAACSLSEGSGCVTSHCKFGMWKVRGWYRQKAIRHKISSREECCCVTVCVLFEVWFLMNARMLFLGRSFVVVVVMTQCRYTTLHEKALLRSENWKISDCGRVLGDLCVCACVCVCVCACVCVCVHMHVCVRVNVTANFVRSLLSGEQCLLCPSYSTYM